MAVRTHPIFTNFRRGEITPRLFGRVDWEGYQNACVTLENFIVQPQGGVTRRPGTRFVAEVKDSTKKVRLIPFHVSDEAVYVLEVGEEYIRFYKNNARVEESGTPVEVATDYLEADLPQIHYTKIEQNLAFVHGAYPPSRLTRYSDTSWRFTEVVFDPPPSREYGTRPTVTLTPAATTGNNIIFTASGNIFLAADISRDIIVDSNGSQARIISVDTTVQVHADILQDFPNVSTVASADWHMDGSPQTTITPNVAGPIYGPVTLTLSALGWHDDDTGKYVLMSGGVVQIISFTNQVVTGKILVELDGTTAQSAGAWSLEEAAWSVANGYPSAVGFVENRLGFAGSDEEPNSIWLSATYDPPNFALGSTDDAAIIIRANSGDNSRIRWFSDRRKLLMGTATEEFTIQAPNDAAFTPSNIKPTPATPHGSNFIQPLRMEYATLFVTTNGKILRELAYAYEVDDYRAPNLLDIAEHITRSNAIVDLAYQRPPDSLIWIARDDGQFPSCVYLREQDLVAWSRHVTDGVVESLCTCESADGTREELWMVVKRTIGGVEKRFIEYMDAAYDDQWAEAPGLVTDCAVTVSSGTATNTVTGLDHLEGETVQIVGDGAVFPPAVVASGTVILAGGTASNIEVGLGFDSTLQTVRPEIPANGTSQGRPKAWTPIIVLFDNSIGGLINGEIVSSSTPPVLFSGKKRVDKLNWDDDAFITIEQKQPLPMTILSITGVVAVGD